MPRRRLVQRARVHSQARHHRASAADGVMVNVYWPCAREGGWGKQPGWKACKAWRAQQQQQHSRSAQPARRQQESSDTQQHTCESSQSPPVYPSTTM